MWHCMSNHTRSYFCAHQRLDKPQFVLIHIWPQNPEPRVLNPEHIFNQAQWRQLETSLFLGNLKQEKKTERKLAVTVWLDDLHVNCFREKRWGRDQGKEWTKIRQWAKKRINEREWKKESRESSWSWRAQPSGMCLAVGCSRERAVRSLEPIPSCRGQRQEENRGNWGLNKADQAHMHWDRQH